MAGGGLFGSHDRGRGLSASAVRTLGGIERYRSEEIPTSPAPAGGDASALGVGRDGAAGGAEGRAEGEDGQGAPAGDAPPAAECSICLDTFRNEEVVRRLACGHVFHKRCVDQWLTKVAACPLCRVNPISGEPMPTEGSPRLESPRQGEGIDAPGETGGIGDEEEPEDADLALALRLSLDEAVRPESTRPDPTEAGTSEGTRRGGGGLTPPSHFSSDEYEAPSSSGCGDWDHPSASTSYSGSVADAEELARDIELGFLAPRAHVVEASTAAAGWGAWRGRESSDLPALSAAETVDRRHSRHLEALGLPGGEDEMAVPDPCQRPQRARDDGV